MVVHIYLRTQIFGKQVSLFIFLWLGVPKFYLSILYFLLEPLYHSFLLHKHLVEIVTLSDCLLTLMLDLFDTLFCFKPVFDLFVCNHSHLTALVLQQVYQVLLYLAEINTALHH